MHVIEMTRLMNVMCKLSPKDTPVHAGMATHSISQSVAEFQLRYILFNDGYFHGVETKCLPYESSEHDY